MAFALSFEVCCQEGQWTMERGQASKNSLSEFLINQVGIETRTFDSIPPIHCTQAGLSPLKRLHFDYAVGEGGAECKRCNVWFWCNDRSETLNIV